jgi:hypothetical protein
LTLEEKVRAQLTTQVNLLDGIRDAILEAIVNRNEEWARAALATLKSTKTEINNLRWMLADESGSTSVTTTESAQ